MKLSLNKWIKKLIANRFKSINFKDNKERTRTL